MREARKKTFRPRSSSSEESCGMARRQGRCAKRPEGRLAHVAGQTATCFRGGQAGSHTCFGLGRRPLVRIPPQRHPPGPQPSAGWPRTGLQRPRVPHHLSTSAPPRRQGRHFCNDGPASVQPARASCGSDAMRIWSAASARVQFLHRFVHFVCAICMGSPYARSTVCIITFFSAELFLAGPATSHPRLIKSVSGMTHRLHFRILTHCCWQPSSCIRSQKASSTNPAHGGSWRRCEGVPKTDLAHRMQPIREMNACCNCAGHLWQLFAFKSATCKAISVFM